MARYLFFYDFHKIFRKTVAYANFTAPNKLSLCEDALCGGQQFNFFYLMNALVYVDIDQTGHL